MVSWQQSYFCSKEISSEKTLGKNTRQTIFTKHEFAEALFTSRLKIFASIFKQGQSLVLRNQDDCRIL